MGSVTGLVVEPVTGAQWADLAALFSTSPVMRGCWCVWPRTPRAAFEFGAENESRDVGSVMAPILAAPPLDASALGPQQPLLTNVFREV